MRLLTGIDGNTLRITREQTGNCGYPDDRRCSFSITENSEKFTRSRPRPMNGDLKVFLLIIVKTIDEKRNPVLPHHKMIRILQTSRDL